MPFLGGFGVPLAAGLAGGALGFAGSRSGGGDRFRQTTMPRFTPEAGRLFRGMTQQQQAGTLGIDPQAQETFRGFLSQEPGTVSPAGQATLDAQRSAGMRGLGQALAGVRSAGRQTPVGRTAIQEGQAVGDFQSMMNQLLAQIMMQDQQQQMQAAGALQDMSGLQAGLGQQLINLGTGTRTKGRGTPAPVNTAQRLAQGLTMGLGAYGAARDAG